MNNLKKIMLVIALCFLLNEGIVCLANGNPQRVQCPDNTLELRNKLVSGSILKISCSSNQKKVTNATSDQNKEYKKVKPFIQYVKFNNAYKVNFPERSDKRNVWNCQFWQGKKWSIF